PHLEALTTEEFRVLGIDTSGYMDYKPTWRDYQRLGRAYLAAGQVEQALETLRRVREMHPAADLHVELGIANAELGNWDRALEHFNTVLERNPNHPAANFYLGVRAMREGRLQDAGQAFRRAAV